MQSSLLWALFAVLWPLATTGDAQKLHDVINSTGGVQFRYLDSTIQIPNTIHDTTERDQSIKVTFELILQETKIKKAENKKDFPNVWLLSLDDDTDLEVTAKTEQNIEQYYFVWPQHPDQEEGRGVCFQLGQQDKIFW